MRKVTYSITDEAYKKLLHMSLLFHVKPSILIQMLIFAVDIDTVSENLE